MVHLFLKDETVFPWIRDKPMKFEVVGIINLTYLLRSFHRREVDVVVSHQCIEDGFDVTIEWVLGIFPPFKIIHLSLLVILNLLLGLVWSWGIAGGGLYIEDFLCIIPSPGGIEGFLLALPFENSTIEVSFLNSVRTLRLQQLLQ